MLKSSEKFFLNENQEYEVDLYLTKETKGCITIGVKLLKTVSCDCCYKNNCCCFFNCCCSSIFKGYKPAYKYQCEPLLIVIQEVSTFKIHTMTLNTNIENITFSNLYFGTYIIYIYRNETLLKTIKILLDNSNMAKRLCPTIII